MDKEGPSKAPKDKQCPYCGRSFTSSSLGRHLDLYIRAKNPKAPDGLHDVDEIRELRGSITRRHPRRVARRNSSAPRYSQAGSKKSCGTSDGESIMTTSLEDGNIGSDTAHSRSNSQRGFNRQSMKSSLDVKQRIQDAIDTSKAAELALREMMGSWRAAKLHSEFRTMPFDFNPLSMDFPALCLQCLEAPPTLHSSTPHSTSKSWSITPPGEKQNEALRNYFRDESRKWKTRSSSAASAEMEGTNCTLSQAGPQQRKPSHRDQGEESLANDLEGEVVEHLDASFLAWMQLSMQRQQELWVLEMARSIDKRQKEVMSLSEARQVLKQENANLRFQIDHLSKPQQAKEPTILLPQTSTVDERSIEFWSELGATGRQNPRASPEDHRYLNDMVTNAIERWRNVIVATRTANASNMQRSLDLGSANPSTPASATHPLSPQFPRSTPQQHSQRSGKTRYRPQSSTNEQPPAARNASPSSAGQTATASEPRTSAASTPTQSLVEDLDEDADADADEDIEMGEESQYLSNTNTMSHHTISLPLAQHPGSQQHQMHNVSRPYDPQMSAVRHSPYSQRDGPYEARTILQSQQMQMDHRAFGQQLQNLEHHLTQSHGSMGWNNHR